MLLERKGVGEQTPDKVKMQQNILQLIQTNAVSTTTMRLGGEVGKLVLVLRWLCWETETNSNYSVSVMCY